MFVRLTQINDCVALLLVFSVSFMALCSAEMRYGFHISVFWQNNKFADAKSRRQERT